MTEKRFTFGYGGITWHNKSDKGDYSTRDLLEICTWLNKQYGENEQLKTRLHEERELAMRLGRECDTLTIKKQELELEIIRLEEIIKTGNR